MKQRRRLGVLFGGLGLILLTILIWSPYPLSFSWDDSRLAAFCDFQPEGEASKVSELTKDQRIEITLIRTHDRTEPDCYTFILNGSRSGQLLVIKRAVIFKNNWGATPGDKIGSAYCELTTETQKNFDVLLQFLRRKYQQSGRYPDTYEIEYFSGERKIGSEKIVDYMQLPYFYQSEYENLDESFRRVVAIDDWNALRSICTLLFELEEKAGKGE